MTEQTVLNYTNQRGVATVAINNPKKFNAFDDTIVTELTAAFEEIKTNKDNRVMILAATGKNFSAGGDIDWMKRVSAYSYKDNLDDAKALANMLKTLHFMPIPTIARVQGIAFGGAVGLVACCDMAIATTQASFGLSEAKMGLIPATISPYVINAIGQRAARRYFMTAERFDAETAAQLGLISEVVEEERLDEEINRLVEFLLANSPAALDAAKKLISVIAGREINDALIDFTSEQIANIRVSKEGKEGISAFLEKRKPSWSSN